jgi:hypothetical protein
VKIDVKNLLTAAKISKIKNAEKASDSLNTCFSFPPGKSAQIRSL